MDFQRRGEEIEEDHIHMNPARILFCYRITLQSTNGVLSAEFLMGRRLRCAIDLVLPDLHKRVEREQERQKVACDPHTEIRGFKVGDLVYV